jgi:hypothetical protein
MCDAISPRVTLFPQLFGPVSTSVQPGSSGSFVPSVNVKDSIEKETFS